MYAVRIQPRLAGSETYHPSIDCRPTPTGVTKHITVAYILTKKLEEFVMICAKNLGDVMTP